MLSMRYSKEADRQEAVRKPGKEKERPRTKKKPTEEESKLKNVRLTHMTRAELTAYVPQSNRRRSCKYR